MSRPLNHFNHTGHRTRSLPDLLVLIAVQVALSGECWVHPTEDHCLAAAELANWLEQQPFLGCQKAEIVTGENWRDQVINRTGIICFEDYYLPSGGSGGDHIDLWNGSRMTDLSSGLRTRFGITIPTVWSDLRKARKTRLFPIV